MKHSLAVEALYSLPTRDARYPAATARERLVGLTSSIRDTVLGWLDSRGYCCSPLSPSLRPTGPPTGTTRAPCGSHPCARFMPATSHGYSLRGPCVPEKRDPRLCRWLSTA